MILASPASQRGAQCLHASARRFFNESHRIYPFTTSRLSRGSHPFSSTVRFAHRNNSGKSRSNWWRFEAPPPPRYGHRRVFAKAVGGAALLSPAAFVAIGEENRDDNRTGEDYMLEASRKELDEAVPAWLENSHGFRIAIYNFIDDYIVEPIATGIRFLHLVVIFVPVIIAIPAIFIGKRLPERDNERSGTLWWYGFLVNGMERSGAAFIKLGQWAASRSDIFPKEMCLIMGALHSNAPPHSLRKTKAIIEHAFNGRKFDDIFEEFHEKPLGVGAIAQVYKAKLKPDLVMPGDVDVAEKPTLTRTVRKNIDAIAKSSPQRVPSQYVAIKVLHPKAERIVRRDLRIMGFFAAVINTIPTMEWLSFPDEVKQFGEMMKLQLDLRIEAANLTKFRKNFKDRTTAWFPYPYSDYTTREVLIEEFAHGIPLEAFLQDGGGVFQKAIADEGLDAFLRMVLIDNFIHADLHPGNIMVRFYKSAQIAVPAPMDFFARSSESLRTPPASTPKVKTPQEADEHIAVQNGNEVSPMAPTTDVTEEVLSRLRPHRHKPKDWQHELSLIEQDGYRPQLIFIDTGLVTELNHTNRTNFLDLFKAVAEFDGYKAGHLMTERCRQPDAVLDKEVFALRMQHLVLNVKSRTFALGNIKIGDILSEVLDMVRGHHVRLEGDFVNVVLSILLLEGIGRSLDPNMDLFAGALPILRQLGAQGGRSLLRSGIGSGDFSMLKVWAGLEARHFITATVEEVDACVKYDQLSPMI